MTVLNMKTTTCFVIHKMSFTKNYNRMYEFSYLEGEL